MVADYVGDGACVAGISNGGIYSPYVVGDTFMKNIIVVFDVGGSSIAFRSRGKY